jgi:uncharacterized repeat protein (TIGR03806 family)
MKLSSFDLQIGARLRVHCIALFAIGALCGCGGGSSGNDSPPAQPPTPPPTVDTTAPTTPSSLTATAVAANRVELNWTASTDTGGSGLSGYRIYRDGSTTALADVTTPAYSDTAVVAATSYSYAVRAFDGAGNESAPSAAVSVTTPSPPDPASTGLDSRPSNTTCLAWPRPAASISLQRYTSLSFNAPLALMQAPGVNTHWYVMEQAGYVRRFSAANPTSASLVLDIHANVESGGEMGLLGMAFHPNFPTDRRVFLSYTTLESGQLRSRISSFETNDNGATLVAASEVVLLRADQPAENHNGGHIAFGPDGFLYIGLGDGGGGGDTWGTNGNGQRLTTLLGKLLRIDVNVDAATRYRVPTSNPFFNASNPTDQCPAAARATGNCPEIYAWGLRNPWRWNFDRENGDLWLADVGQGRYEEVNLVTRGGNYGWRCREGAHDYNSANTQACSSAATIDPLVEYGRTQGQSITGGYVYRGNQTTGLFGRYVFGDFASGRIWAWIPENTTSREPTLLLESGLGISSFAQGNDGELYVLDYNGGTLRRIVFEPSGPGTEAPTALSATGCVNPSDPAQPAAGLISYDVNAPFWSDGAGKERWIGLPDGQTITVGASGDWDFPNGTVLVKSFRDGLRLIETRLFMRHPDGNWGGFSYAWNPEQTDATLVRGGATRDIGGKSWVFPSEAQCMQCHTSAAGRTLGLETAQLNRAHTYVQTNRHANELATLSAIGVLNPVVDPATAAKMPDPMDTTAPLADRARSYLHTNCAQCHRPNGPTPSTMDLRYTTALSATNACNATPQLGTLDLGSAARLIAPSDTANSIVINRTNRRDAHAMPPVGSTVVDEAGVELLTQWVAGLAGC